MHENQNAVQNHPYLMSWKKFKKKKKADYTYVPDWQELRETAKLNPLNSQPMSVLISKEIFA